LFVIEHENRLPLTSNTSKFYPFFNLENGTQIAQHMAACGTGGRFLNSFWNAVTTLAQDIRIGYRMFGHARLLTAAVVLTLSLGIGVTAGVFTLVNPIAFRPPVSDNPNSFIAITTSKRDITLQEYNALRDQTRSVRELAAGAQVFLHQRPEEGPSGLGVLVSCNFFSVFTEKPTLGRLIEPGDCKSSRAVLVLNQRSWREDFGADPNIVGKTVSYFGQSITIVGVLSPQWSTSPDSQFRYDAIGWLSMHPSVAHVIQTGGGPSWIRLSGRLNAGFSRKNAETELQLIDDRFREDPATMDKQRQGRAKLAITVHDGSLWGSRPEVHWPFFLSLALPTLLLFMASVNVATLLLSRAVGRQREMAIRLAVGAGRFRLVRMLLVENTLLAASAAAVSLVLIYWMPSALYGYLFAYQSDTPMPPPEFFAPDWRVFLSLGVCTITATLCSGITPALESLNLRLSDTLAGRQFRGGRHSASRLRSFLVVAQVALTMAPLVAVAMFLRAEGRFTDPGFETAHLAEVRLQGPMNPGTTLGSLVEHFEAIPGVKSAAFAWDTPGMTYNSQTLKSLKGTETLAPMTRVSSNYFDAVGIPIVLGQPFSSSGLSEGGAQPVVISQRLARRLFPETNPLGQIVETGHQEQVEIVGVARDVAGFASRGPADGSFLYEQIPGDSGESLLFVVRFNADLDTITSALQTVAQSATGEPAEIVRVSTAAEQIFAHIRRIETVLIAFAAVSVALAVIGVFGVVSFTTAQRRKEIAIRMAVGADGGSIVRNILSRGLMPIPIGIAAGLLLSWGGMKVAASQEFLPLALPLQDPAPYAAVSLFLLLISSAAILVSARRSVWSDSVNSLRED
jgi:predicted permease